MTRIAVGMVCSGDQVLVGIRPAGVPLAGLLEFPGGKVAAGETPAEAALREVREETGLTVEIVGPATVVSHAYDHGMLELHFFPCRPTPAPPDVPQPEAAVPAPPFTWRPIEGLSVDDFPAANRVVIEMLRKTRSASGPGA